MDTCSKPQPFDITQLFRLRSVAVVGATETAGAQGVGLQKEQADIAALREIAAETEE